MGDGILQSNMLPAKHANRQTPSSRRRTVYSLCPANHVAHDDLSTPSRAVTKLRSARGARTKPDKGVGGYDRIRDTRLVSDWVYGWRGEGPTGLDHARSDTHCMTELITSHRISLRIHVRFNTSKFVSAYINVSVLEKKKPPEANWTMRDQNKKN